MDAVVGYWAEHNQELLLVVEDICFRVVRGPGNAIVGLILWSPAQQCVWSMRFASLPRPKGT